MLALPLLRVLHRDRKEARTGKEVGSDVLLPKVLAKVRLPRISIIL